MPLFTRLTFNENNWVIPSGHLWKEENQGNSSIPYENQHGFGHEEWLFNPRYNIDGWQYGYIRGLSRVHEDIDRVYLYSVNKEHRQNFVYYLGYLNNIEILGNNWRDKFPEVEQVFDENMPLVVQEIEQTNGNAIALNRDIFAPLVRFTMDESEILDTPRLIEDFPLGRYKRFQPYQITDEVLNLLQNGINVVEDADFVFTSGKANQTERFNRYTDASSKAVIRLHSTIIDQLQDFLAPLYTLINRNISIERTRFKGNIADIVTLETDLSISIYEVKTSLNIRKNIRDAVAQLLDYSSHCGNTIVNKLVIVSPCELNRTAEQFMQSLRGLIQIPIHYIQYVENAELNFLE